MAVITSVVLVAPIVGPLSGAALMRLHPLESAVRHYRRHGIGGLARPAVDHAGDGAPRRCAVQPLGVLRDFRNVFLNRIFLLGAATLVAERYIPLMSWVAVSPVILMDAGGLTTSEFAQAGAGLQRRYHRQPVGGALE